MPGFSSLDDFYNEALTNGKVLDWSFYKVAPAAAEAAGVWQTLWKGTGSPGAGSDPATTPGAAAANLAGSMNWGNVSTDKAFLASIYVVANQNCTFGLYDRLVGVSGISLTTTGNKTVSSAALTRYTSTAAAVTSAWLEVTTATTVTAPVVAMNSYTNGAGTSGRAGGNVTFPAVATDLHTAIRLPEEAGSQGIQTCSTINVVTAATAGAATFKIVRELVQIPLIANQGNYINFWFGMPPPPQIFDTASLEMMILASGAVTTTVWGRLALVYG